MVLGARSFHLAVALSAMILISLAGAASAAASESAIQLEDLAQPGELVEASISNLEPGSRYTLQVEGSEAVVAAVAGNVIVESYSGKPSSSWLEMPPQLSTYTRSRPEFMLPPSTKALRPLHRHS